MLRPSIFSRFGNENCRAVNFCTGQCIVILRGDYNAVGTDGTGLDFQLLHYGIHPLLLIAGGVGTGQDADHFRVGRHSGINFHCIGRDCRADVPGDYVRASSTAGENQQCCK
jgi:hypothetical protein